MKVLVGNCRYENLEACRTHSLFGLKRGRLPSIEVGDILLFRVTGHSGEPYGVKAIWQIHAIERVTDNSPIPWKDATYSWLLRCAALVWFLEPFSEEFATSSKVSQKIQDLYAGQIVGSLVTLKPSRAITYLNAILAEKGDELAIETNALGRSASVRDFILHVLDQLEEQLDIAEPVALAKAPSPEPSFPGGLDEPSSPAVNYGVVGERIDLPVLNYAPLNEMGVILLFGYYMQDLGFSHVEEIRAGFPDAIAMQRLDPKKFKRVRIEFEYRASAFKAHGHAIAGCDVIVCWENDWPDCPIDVIELKTTLFEE
jgi:hypothetical protein